MSTRNETLSEHLPFTPENIAYAIFASLIWTLFLVSCSFAIGILLASYFGSVRDYAQSNRDGWLIRAFISTVIPVSSIAPTIWIGTTYALNEFLQSSSQGTSSWTNPSSVFFLADMLSYFVIASTQLYTSYLLYNLKHRSIQRRKKTRLITVFCALLSPLGLGIGVFSAPSLSAELVGAEWARKSLIDLQIRSHIPQTLVNVWNYMFIAHTLFDEQHCPADKRLVPARLQSVLIQGLWLVLAEVVFMPFIKDTKVENRVFWHTLQATLYTRALFILLNARDDIEQQVDANRGASSIEMESGISDSLPFMPLKPVDNSMDDLKVTDEDVCEEAPLLCAEETNPATLP